MSIKWLSQLSWEELVELHGYIIGEENVDSVASIDKYSYADKFEVVFMEHWGEGEDKETIETFYDMEDYYGETAYDCTCSPKEDTQKFREWMVHRFGVDYVYDLIQEVMGLNLVDYLKWEPIE